MTCRMLLGAPLLLLLVGLSGCGSDDALPTPTPVPQPQAVAPPSPAPPPGNWLAGYTLTGVSLSGTVYESTATGPMPISGALVYCELCGEMTHTWATADANGFYTFSGDLANGGGIWLVAGQRIPVLVQAEGYRDPSGSFNPRYVLIVGDTRSDFELARR
jgi:hypothetical protein